jgi:hypothetical protein
MHTRSLKFITPLFPKLLLYGLLACSPPEHNKEFPSSHELGAPEGYRIGRIITHFHSGYSWDGCDKDGLQSNGKIRPACLKSLKKSLCKTKLDVLFLTDHPDAMANYRFKDLLLFESKTDELIYEGSLPVANLAGGCSNGHQTRIHVGFEAKQVMVLGMSQHLSGEQDSRRKLYESNDRELVERLQNEVGALVVTPHLESTNLENLLKLNPDGVEFYNLHANVDPRIRKTHLGADPFMVLPPLLAYLFDPYSKLAPDFAFLSFLEVSEKVLKKWNELILAGWRGVGLSGVDAHENTFPQKVADGERFDSYRRMSRLVTNHILVEDLDISTVKAAIKNASVWSVFEALGSPVGFDYRIEKEGETFRTGQTFSRDSKNLKVTVVLPRLHKDSPQVKKNPRIKLRWIKLLPNGDEKVVAESKGETLILDWSEEGIYRAEVMITPRHLKGYLGDFAELSEQEYPWIITNPIYIE